MEYEVIQLNEKKVVGIEARTNNLAPDMGAVIGGLWNRFYAEGIYLSIPDKAGMTALGIYTDYAGREMDDYTLVVACETQSVPAKEQLPAGTVCRTIPAGKYAKFIVKGDQKEAVGKFWSELWKMNLDRAFVCDFEEYMNSDCNNAEIHIYIGLK